MEKWVVTTKGADFAAIGRRFGIDPITARLIRNRNVIGEEAIETYLHGSFADLHSPHLLKGCDRAVELLREKIRQKKKIRVIGDYDIDGVMATYILYRGLTRCGAAADHDLPHRIHDGYGLNRNLIDHAREAQVDTIVTCDNGIAAIDEIAYARSLGMTVIVTDHHEVGPVLPDADVVMNPHQGDCPYPYKGLCGAAVAYKLIAALYEACGVPESESRALVEFAGFATVGDVMDLTGENRVLVKEGLRMLNRTENKGLRALIRANRLEGKKISAYHIGFVLGPCLNAGGRLETAKKSLALMLASTEQEADALALELLNLNEQRKTMTLEGCEQAAEMIDSGEMKNDKVLAVFLPDCHESIAGIIAGRLRERYCRPALVMTRGENAVKGSGRSIEAYSMYDELQKCRDLFFHFGGHPMAAGFSMPEENVGELRRRLNEYTALTWDDLAEKVQIDAALPLEYLSEKMIGELELLEPFGKGNNKPVFAERQLEILRARVVGANASVLRLRLRNSSGCPMDAVYFGDVEKFREYLEETYGPEQAELAYRGCSNSIRLAVTYYPDINEYNGVKSIQIVIQHYR